MSIFFEFSFSNFLCVGDNMYIN